MFLGKSSITACRHSIAPGRWQLGWFVLVVAVVAASFFGCGRRITTEPSGERELTRSPDSSSQPAESSLVKQSADEHAKAFARVERAEANVLSLTQQIKTLSKDILNLQLPVTSKTLFADSVDVIDLASGEPLEKTEKALQIPLRVLEFAVSEEKLGQRPKDLSLWEPLVSKVQFFEHTKFYIIDGDFAPDSELIFNTKFGFAALARLSDGDVAELKGRIDVQWQRWGDDDT